MPSQMETPPAQWFAVPPPDTPLYERLTAIGDHLVAAQAQLTALPASHPDRVIGRAYSLALTKTEEALMWLHVAEGATLQAEHSPDA